MRSEGYTLIELLVVLTIVSIIGLVGYVSYQQFAANQFTNKAVGQIQTVLRLAQTNATTSTFCGNNQSVGPWSVTFTQGNTLVLECNSILQKAYILENVQIDNVSCGSATVELPLELTYSNGTGTLTFYSAEASDTCLLSPTWTFNLINTKNSSTKYFKITQGGAINVE